MKRGQITGFRILWLGGENSWHDEDLLMAWSIKQPPKDLEPEHKPDTEWKVTPVYGDDGISVYIVRKVVK